MSLMTSILFRLPCNIFTYLFTIFHDSVKYRRFHLPYLKYESTLYYILLYYTNILLYFTNSLTTNFKELMVKYGTSILIYRRDYTGQYFGELPFEKFLMVTK